MKREIKICALLSAALLSVSSCAHMQQEKTGVQTVKVDKADVEGIISKSNEFVAKGDYASALDSYKNATVKYPEDETLQKGYISTIEDIKKTADKAFDKGDFTLAGKTYYLLLKSVPAADGFSSELSFTKKNLTDRLDVCRSALSQEALSQYRSGNIEHAISLWKSLLTFDPGNQSVKKSIDTATTQLKNLKQTN
jgi:outer membrane protein assembly factor BamD (BamD/ComL family)